MPYDTQFHPDRIDPTAFVAPDAVILGDVTVGGQSSIWYKAVLRGDSDAISIGSQTNVQDGCILHTDAGIQCRLGSRVTVGHGAIVHGAEVGDDVMIGMRSVVMNRANIPPGCIIGVGAVVTEGTQVPPNSLVLGVPGRVARITTEDERRYIRAVAAHYVEAARAFRESRTGDEA